jgi:aspartate carbamoyltransferase catalytic subunit
MRTMHSIGYAMSKFDISGTFVAPPEMSLTQEFKEELHSLNLRFNEAETTEESIADADVIYMEPVVQADYTRSRVEAAEERGLTPPAYRVTREMLRDKGRSDAIVLHSLPRMDELPIDVDDTRHARYWFEAYNGVVVRMALLALILGAVE